MALSLSHFPISLVLLLALAIFAEAANKTVTYNFNITWVNANPDGAFERPTIGINGQWPLPVMTAEIGDQVIVNVDNQLGNQTTTLHFHGLYQNGSSTMDGPSQVSQCGIPAGSQFTYNFTVSYFATNMNQPATNMSPGQPSWYLLVPFSRSRPIPRWSTSSLHNQRPGFPI